ncbi:MAG: serine/threonine protein kinase [Phycisphaerae bacterium]|nr:serine/threonine protein kinase [Phycisphaerae bacterium]
MSSLGAIPAELFGFKVVDKIGEGAASAVYAVMDTKSRQVMALKHVHRRSEKDQRFVDQIEQEYKVGSRLDHPNIRAITKYMKNQRFMFGPVSDVALLMELVDAATLDVAPRPSAEKIARYFAQGARALAHMHDRGFVHADMKPSNMMVTEDGVVKIIDLGQACAIGAVKKRIQGTPGYIAPEQAHRQEITPLTDVYNFGATLYWVLLREEIPCALPSRNGTVSGAVESSQIRLPTPPHEQDPRIPAELSMLAMECIQVQPERRVQSMGELSDRFDRIAETCARSGIGAELEGLVGSSAAPNRPYDSQPSRSN